jgi:hypothetical protein
MSRFTLFFAISLSLLLLGIGGAVIAATIEIESIVATGPVFSLIGLSLSIAWIFYRRVPALPLIGMSLPILSLIVFALINLLEWSPDEASRPVSTTLLVYQAVVVAIGLNTLRSILADGRFVPSNGGGQFSIRSLLILTGVLGVALGAIKFAIDHGARARCGLAVGFTAITAAGLAAIFISRLWTWQVPGHKSPPPEMFQPQLTASEGDRTAVENPASE